MKQAQGAPTPRSATQTALPGPVPLHAGLKCRLGFWLETTTATTATGGPCSVVLSRCISQEIWGEVAQKSRKKIKKKNKNTPELGSGFIPTRPSYPFHLLVVTWGANDTPWRQRCVMVSHFIRTAVLLCTPHIRVDTAVEIDMGT